VDPVSHSFCKLLVALGDHSTGYFASNIASTAQAVPVSSNPASIPPNPTKAHLVQTFLKLLLSYTGLPGVYGTDEDESEMTLGFWYLFQEALWSADYYFEDGEGDGGFGAGDGDVGERDKDQWIISKAVYAELVSVLRRKVVYPDRAELSGWAKGRLHSIFSKGHWLNRLLCRSRKCISSVSCECWYRNNSESLMVTCTDIVGMLAIPL
jgi:hypothetical protein